MPQSKLPTGSGTILLVDDEEIIRSVTARALRLMGYTVLDASGPQDALRMIEDMGALDLLLTDVVMPGMNGPELARRILKRSSDVRVLYMTGHSDGSISLHGAADSGTAVLQKPFSLGDLTRKVREALDSR